MPFKLGPNSYFGLLTESKPLACFTVLGVLLGLVPYFATATKKVVLSATLHLRSYKEMDWSQGSAIEAVVDFTYEAYIKSVITVQSCYTVGNEYRINDDDDPYGTAGKPIHSAIENSGVDRLMVVVIRHYGGTKLGTGGLVRAYGGVAGECLKSAATQLIKSKVPIGVEVTFDLLGVVYHQSFKAEEIKQDYDTRKDGITMVTVKISFD